MHFGIILEEIKSSHHSAPLSLLGRAEPIGRRAPSAHGGTAQPLELWLLQMRFMPTRLMLASECRTALAPACQSAVALTLRLMQPSTIVFHATLHYLLMQIAVHFSCFLPSLSPSASCTCNAPQSLQYDAPHTGRRRRFIQAHSGPESRRRDESLTNSSLHQLLSFWS